MKKAEIEKYVSEGDLITWLYVNGGRGFGVIKEIGAEWLWLDSGSGLNPDGLVTKETRRATEEEAEQYKLMCQPELTALEYIAQKDYTKAWSEINELELSLGEIVEAIDEQFGMEIVVEMLNAKPK